MAGIIMPTRSSSGRQLLVVSLNVLNILRPATAYIWLKAATLPGENNLDIDQFLSARQMGKPITLTNWHYCVNYDYETRKARLTPQNLQDSWCSFDAEYSNGAWTIKSAAAPQQIDIHNSKYYESSPDPAYRPRIEFGALFDNEWNSWWEYLTMGSGVPGQQKDQIRWKVYRPIMQRPVRDAGRREAKVAIGNDGTFAQLRDFEPGEVITPHSLESGYHGIHRYLGDFAVIEVTTGAVQQGDFLVIEGGLAHIQVCFQTMTSRTKDGTLVKETKPSFLELYLPDSKPGKREGVIGCKEIVFRAVTDMSPQVEPFILQPTDQQLLVEELDVQSLHKPQIVIGTDGFSTESPFTPATVTDFTKLVSPVGESGAIEEEISIPSPRFQDLKEETPVLKPEEVEEEVQEIQEIQYEKLPTPRGGKMEEEDIVEEIILPTVTNNRPRRKTPAIPQTRPRVPSFGQQPQVIPASRPSRLKLTFTQGPSTKESTTAALSDESSFDAGSDSDEEPSKPRTLYRLPQKLSGQAAPSRQQVSQQDTGTDQNYDQDDERNQRIPWTMYSTADEKPTWLPKMEDFFENPNYVPESASTGPIDYKSKLWQGIVPSEDYPREKIRIDGLMTNLANGEYERGRYQDYMNRFQRGELDPTEGGEPPPGRLELEPEHEDNLEFRIPVEVEDRPQLLTGEEYDEWAWRMQKASRGDKQRGVMGRQMMGHSQAIMQIPGFVPPKLGPHLEGDDAKLRHLTSTLRHGSFINNGEGRYSGNPPSPVYLAREQEQLASKS
ncbi:hypothetical protein H072_10330 [Dactylellina haptotyla CBS 200.50]|uniref:Uncharacterized protein n=1 Tax=Dactylellina haptotyla (strain CBS 200.50) TaxID=1284197 RepID=S8A0F8_DACHA|nr:hypothetical protein H072_10330 [Dactylellina haptotyla CBS 200.50]